MAAASQQRRPPRGFRNASCFRNYCEPAASMQQPMALSPAQPTQRRHFAPRLLVGSAHRPFCNSTRLLATMPSPNEPPVASAGAAERTLERLLKSPYVSRFHPALGIR